MEGGVSMGNIQEEVVRETTALATAAVSRPEPTLLISLLSHTS